MSAPTFESLSHVSLPCRDLDEAKRPKNASPRGHGAVVDLASLSYDHWGQ